MCTLRWRQDKSCIRIKQPDPINSMKILAGWAGVQDFSKYKVKYCASAQYLTCYNPHEWTQSLGVSTGHKKREMLAFSTFGRGVCGWQWQHCLTPHPAEGSSTPDTEAWAPTFNKHPEPLCLPHWFALASYCKLLSHSLFLPPHNSPRQFPLLTLSDFTIMKLHVTSLSDKRLVQKFKTFPVVLELLWHSGRQVCSSSSEMERETLSLRWVAMPYLR